MTSSKTSTGPSKAALPYLNQATGALNSAYNPSAVSGITDTLTNQIPTVLGSTLSNPTLAAANTYDQNTLTSNPDPTTNPLFMNMLKDTNSSTADAVNANIGTRGLAGGSAQTQLLASQIAKADNTALLGQYNTNVTNQNTAASNAATLSSANDSNISALLAYLSGTAQLPTAVASQYADGISNLWGKSTTTTQSPSLLSSAEGIGGTIASLGSAFSDRRTKTDIVKIDELPDGLGIYQYHYKAGGPLRTGVMADEVAALRPWALGPSIEGVATVHYGLL